MKIDKWASSKSGTGRLQGPGAMPNSRYVGSWLGSKPWSRGYDSSEKLMALLVLSKLLSSLRGVGVLGGWNEEVNTRQLVVLLCVYLFGYEF